MDELLEWTENLNFDAYVKDWYQLSTSESSKDFVPKFVNTLDFNVLIWITTHMIFKHLDINNNADNH